MLESFNHTPAGGTEATQGFQFVRYDQVTPIFLVFATDIFAGELSLSLISRENFAKDTILRIAFPPETGLEIVHNAEEDGLNTPIWLQLNENYVTKKEYEALDLQLIEYETGKWHWRDMNQASVAGSVVPVLFTATKGQAQGYKLQPNDEIYGFRNGELSTMQIFGDGAFTPNPEGNVLKCTQANTIVTNVKNIVTDEVFCAALGIDAQNEGIGLIVSNLGRPLYVKMASFAIGYSDNALFAEHPAGFVLLDIGKFIVNNASGEALVDLEV